MPLRDIGDLHVVRDRVKTQLENEFRVLFPKSGKPVSVCRFCTGPLFNSADMHEWLVTRGDAQGWSDEETLKIFVPCNCMLLHPTCHQKFGASRHWLPYLAKKQVDYYGPQTFLNWINSLPWKVNSLRDERLAIVYEAAMKSKPILKFLQRPMMPNGVIPMELDFS
jgi:hypothetical protein